jgi:hypothetical protein
MDNPGKPHKPRLFSPSSLLVRVPGGTGGAGCGSLGVLQSRFSLEHTVNAVLLSIGHSEAAWALSLSRQRAQDKAADHEQARLGSEDGRPENTHNKRGRGTAD